MDEMPLPALFEQGRKIHNMVSESGVDQGTLRNGCEALQQCEEMISKLGLFSANETKDDISTTNLKSLLAWLTTISLALYKVFDLLEMLKKEEEMLSAVREKQLQGNEESAREVLDE